MKKLPDLIPKGPYCYFGSRAPKDKNYKPCPYWEMKHEDGEAYGYCNFLGLGDNDVGTLGLLWDQVKECDENMGHL